MGQQQLLLIVLGVIIVGIAIAVGLAAFKSEAGSSNRDNLVTDLERLGETAQQYYREPSSMNGGARNFMGFALSPADTGNADGSFSVSMQAPTDRDFTKGSVRPIGNPAQTIYIIGCGTETGNDGRRAVKAYAIVTPDSLTVRVMN